jgi:hypothetical protein
MANYLKSERMLHANAFDLIDDAGRLRATLRLLPDGSPHLIFNDKNGQFRLGLGIQSDGSSNLVLSDGKGLPTLVDCNG